MCLPYFPLKTEENNKPCQQDQRFILFHLNQNKVYNSFIFKFCRATCIIKMICYFKVKLYGPLVCRALFTTLQQTIPRNSYFLSPTFLIREKLEVARGNQKAEKQISNLNNICNLSQEALL